MFTLFRSKPIRDAAVLAYGRIVEQARRPEFFTMGGVPDTLDGRFELICLHAFLYLHRLRREQTNTARLGQYFCDEMFADFDRSLREIGIGDLSVGHEVKRMAQAFYGRVAVYERGLADGDDVLRPALARNLFGTTTPTPARLAAMADYMRGEVARLDRQAPAELLAGRPEFGAPSVTAPVPERVAAR